MKCLEESTGAIRQSLKTHFKANVIALRHKVDCKTESFTSGIAHPYIIRQEPAIDTSNKADCALVEQIKATSFSFSGDFTQ